MDLFAPWHLLIVLLIVLLIFGPRKLGDVGGALGKAIRDFKEATSDVESLTSSPVSNAANSQATSDKTPPA